MLSAKPYAFLDDAPLEERRTQAVMSRRWLDPESAADIGKLDAEAIARVRAEAWPDARNADELHDALLWLDLLHRRRRRRAVRLARVARGSSPRARRVTQLAAPRARCGSAPERLPLFKALFPRRACSRRS